jgi:hypothetical protein
MVQGLARAIERTTNLIKFSHNLRIIESLKRNSADNLIPNKKCTICGKIKYHLMNGLFLTCVYTFKYISY